MKIIYSFISILFFSITALAQDAKKFIGKWEGKINVGIEIRVVFNFKDDGKGGITATTDSPDQNAFDIPVKVTSVTQDIISLEIEAVNATFTGKLENDSTMNGKIMQGVEIPVILTKKEGNEKTPELKRPQTPKPPFAYNSEDVEYDNADKKVHYGATFTYPKTGGPFVTAVLITGSGQQDRDETMLGHKPFAIIADYLTQKGFAVLRVDDRGAGKSTGASITTTSADFAKDVMTSMDYLKTRKEVAPKRIGLIGHSEGGMIASIVVAERKDIAFIISLAGTGIKGSKLLADQNEAILVKNGVSKEAAALYKKLLNTIYALVEAEPDSISCQPKVIAEYEAWKKTTTPAQLAELRFGPDEANKTYLRNYVNELYSPWLRYFLSYDPSVNYKKAYCPVLALNGSEDLQVLADDNLNGIEQALKKSKSPSYEIKKLPGLNHLFQHCTKCDLNEYAKIEESFSPEVLQLMSDWLKKTIK